MRVTLILGESTASALMIAAAREDRPPRDQAHRYIREALIQAGILVPYARPCDRPDRQVMETSAEAEQREKDLMA